MRIAVISDVHGNRLALEAVLADIERRGCDSTVNLGDHVAGPMEPQWTADILMDLDIPTIKGNHERYLFDRPHGALGKVDAFVMSVIERRHLDWFRWLPSTMTILDEVFMCHGTPTSDEEPWLDAWWEGRTTTVPSEADVVARAEGHDYRLMLCGHTHLPRIVRLRDGRMIINPGSVGLQINHGAPDARYAIIERTRAGEWSASLTAVPYDHEGAAAQAVKNGFPDWVEALTTGWVGAKGLF
jgi:predicted phosphodiesterase